MLFLSGSPKRIVVILAGLLFAGGIAITTLHFVSPNATSAVVNRALSVKEEIAQGHSFKRRSLENEYAVRSLVSSPILGLGLGARYKPYSWENAWEGEHRYIHNSFLYLAVKLGILAPLLALLVLYRITLAARDARRKSLVSSDRALMDSTTVGFLTPALVTAFTQPEWMSYAGVAFMATMLGLFVALRAIAQSEARLH
jgi:O-antigen ligase